MLCQLDNNVVSLYRVCIYDPRSMKFYINEDDYGLLHQNNARPPSSQKISIASSRSVINGLPRNYIRKLNWPYATLCYHQKWAQKYKEDVVFFSASFYYIVDQWSCFHFKQYNDIASEWRRSSGHSLHHSYDTLPLLFTLV